MQMGTILRRHSGAAPRGFTLVELLVVLVVSAILVTTAVPIYKQTIATYRLDSEVNALVGDLQYARSEAIKQGTTVVMCVSTNQTSCSTSDNNWAHGHIVGTNSPTQTGTAASVTNLGSPLLRQMIGFSGTDTAYGNQVAGTTSGANIYAIEFNRDGFAGLPSTTNWNGFATLGGNVFLKVYPASGQPGVGKCVAISLVGQIQVLPIGAHDVSGTDTCQ